MNYKPAIKLASNGYLFMDNHFLYKVSKAQSSHPNSYSISLHSFHICMTFYAAHVHQMNNAW